MRPSRISTTRLARRASAGSCVMITSVLPCLHRSSLSSQRRRTSSVNGVVTDAVKIFLRSETEANSPVFIVRLADDVALDFEAFRKAHFSADRTEVIETALRAFVAEELAHDLYVRERFKTAKEEL